MNRQLAWSTHVSTFLVGASGLVYAYVRYAMSPMDEFSVLNHPWQPTLLSAHLWFAPLLVFCIGLLWTAHIWSHLRSGVRSRRRSGWAMLLMVAPMILSGALIQTSVEPFWRQIWVALHILSGSLFLLGYLGHLVAALWIKARPKQRTRSRKVLEETPGLG